MAREPKSSITFCKSVAISPPAVRMVVLQAWADDNGDVGVTAMPVVGLSASVIQMFDKPGTHPDPATTGEAIRKGWEGASPELVYDCLVVDDEYGLVAATFLQNENQPNIFQPVACPWPPEEDENRLAGRAADLKRRIHLVDRRARLKAKTGGVGD